MYQNRSDKCFLKSTYTYPFGMMMSGRTWEAGSSHRYGFNGKEQDSEPYGEGNIYDYGFRIYNPRISKFLSVDPLTSSYPWYTPYQFAGNKPVIAIDIDGLEEKIQITMSYDFREGKPILETQTFIDDFKERGPLGDGTLYVDVQFIEQDDGDFSVVRTLSYAEPDESGILNNYQTLDYVEINANEESAKAYRSYLKNFKGYFYEDEEFKGRFQEWKDSNLDPTALEELAHVFGGPQGNWRMEDFDDSSPKKSRGIFERDISFVPGDDTTYITNEKGDTTKFRVYGKDGSRSEGAFIEYKYPPNEKKE